jgi:HEPN domain-containing protein
MRINAEIYYRAAFERIEDAHLLHEEGHYPFAIYASGLAVECLLRAFRVLKEPSFDERHDLWLLWKNTALSDVHREPSYSQIYQTLMTISRFWNNGHRFASQNALRNFLKRIGADRGIKGDFLKYSSKMLYEAANEFLRLGVVRWKQLNKK